MRKYHVSVYMYNNHYDLNILARTSDEAETEALRLVSQYGKCPCWGCRKANCRFIRRIRNHLYT